MRQKWSHSAGWYVFGQGRGEDVGREELESVGGRTGRGLVDCRVFFKILHLYYILNDIPKPIGNDMYINS
jgi:hypothetical protein